VSDLRLSNFADAVAARIMAETPFRYQSKASRSEREAGLEGWGMTKPPQEYGLIAGGNTPQQTPHKNEPRANHHPTVKPLSLTRWLATLLLPPAEYAPRRLFCPFAGVGSECIGAAQAGWEEVVGVELEAEYVVIGNARIKHHTAPERQGRLPL